MEEQKTELKLIKMSDVQSQEILWLWYPFIPYGKLTIIQGDPGDGKTTFVLNIAAQLSKGTGLEGDIMLSSKLWAPVPSSLFYPKLSVRLFFRSL